MANDRYPLHITIFDQSGRKKITAYTDSMWEWPNEESVTEYVMAYPAKKYPDHSVEVDDGSIAWRFRTGRLAGQPSVQLLRKTLLDEPGIDPKTGVRTVGKTPYQRKQSHSTKKTPPGQFRGKRPRGDASFGGAQWGQEPPDIYAPKEPRLTYLRTDDRIGRKTAAQLEAEIEAFLREDAARLSTGRGSHSTKKPPVTQLAPIYHDRLATGIARVVRDPYFWRGGRFDLAEALKPLAAKRGHYDWQLVKDWTDDYLQKVAGTAGSTGEGIPSRATHPVTKYEVDAVNAIVNALRRAEKQS